MPLKRRKWLHTLKSDLLSVLFSHIFFFFGAEKKMSAASWCDVQHTEPMDSREEKKKKKLTKKKKEIQS